MFLNRYLLIGVFLALVLGFIVCQRAGDAPTQLLFLQGENKRKTLLHEFCVKSPFASIASFGVFINNLVIQCS
jgi:hypothetical protein